MPSSHSPQKNDVLQEYNQLFKRKEEVPLNHRWLSDDEDARADIEASDESEEKRRSLIKEESQG